MEVDNNAKEKVQKESSFESSPKCGDQIQVVISGKNVFKDHHRGIFNISLLSIQICLRY